MTLILSRGDTEGIGPGQQAGSARTPRPFPRLSKLLHWLTAVLVLAMFATGVTMKQLGDGSLADALYTLHKVTGVGLLGLVLLRLGYRIAMQMAGRWHPDVGARAVHGLLYAGLILVPLLGWAGISDYGARGVYFGLSLPAIWPEGAGHAGWLFMSHAVLAFAMIGLVVVHIGIALGDYIQRGSQREPTAAASTKKASPAGADMP